MPILHIHAVLPARPESITPMLKAACADGAKALGCPIQNVWAIFNEVAPGRYVEGDAAATERRPGSHPAIVYVRALKGRSVEVKTAFLKAVTTSIAAGLGIAPGDVWAHYVEMNHSDVWSNGQWVG